MKTVVLHGNVPESAGKDEQDVLIQAETICRSLSELGHLPVALPVSLDFKTVSDNLKIISPDFVFNIVESINGCGDLIHIAPAILDTLHLPYTGARTDAMYLTSNKVLAKKFLDAAGLPTPPLFTIDGNEKPVSGCDYIVKAVWEHASVWMDDHSIIRVEDSRALRQAIRSQEMKLSMACFAEPFIEGREFNLSILAGKGGPEVLPPAEIQFRNYPADKKKVVDYRSKWMEDSFEYHHTPRCFDFPEEDEALTRHLSELACRCWHLFNLRGYARIDFRVDDGGNAWILEVNTNPCLSPDGGFAAAVERAGMTFNEAIERIVHEAVNACHSCDA
jgi:D-alanine-D-alanine ligase